MDTGYKKKPILGYESYSNEFDDNPVITKLFYISGKSKSAKRGLKYDDIRDNLSHRMINLNNLADSCKDFCPFYEKNCYNKNSSECFLRIIELYLE